MRVCLVLLNRLFIVFVMLGSMAITGCGGMTCDQDGDGMCPPEDCNDYNANIQNCGDDDATAGDDDSSNGGDDDVTQPGDDDDITTPPGDDVTTPPADDVTTPPGDDDSTCTPQPYYQDLDKDGYGNSSEPSEACTAPPGYVAKNGDCDDQDSSVNPGAPEICNGKDDDCNGGVDDIDATPLQASSRGEAMTMLLDPRTWKAGHAMLAASVLFFGQNAQTSGCQSGGDDDDATEISPTPAGSPTPTLTPCPDPTVWYADADRDGYGNPGRAKQACMQPVGYVSDNTDCDDGNAGVHPAATEICNGIDDDCDGSTDEGVSSTFYQDSDGDGYGNALVSVQACSVPSGYLSDNTDCNDGNVGVHPGATEICNSIDDDCDGSTDEVDGDHDGFEPIACGGGDCDDANANVHPGEIETCNGLDDDCDGQVDEGLTCQACRVAADGSADYDSISSALDDIYFGDLTCPNNTIYVGPGTYVEDLRIAGMKVTLKSEEGAAKTFIAGSGSGPVVSITVDQKGVAADATLDGFTLTGGSGWTLSPCSSGQPCGGGVYIDQVSNGTFLSNTITKNTAYNGAGVYVGPGGELSMTRNSISGNAASYGGGGIYLAGCDPTLHTCAVATLMNNTIGGSSGNGNTAFAGGGIFIKSGAEATMSGNAISSNGKNEYTYGVFVGGGLYAEGTGNAPVFSSSNDTFSGNVMSDLGYGYRGNGGGIYMVGGLASLDGTQVTGNYSLRTGGGIYLSGATLSATRAAVNVVSNVADRDGGGGIYAVNSTVTFSTTSQSNISSNSSSTCVSGMGAYLSGVALSMRNVKFASNAACATSGYGGGLFAEKLTAQQGSTTAVLDSVTFTGNSAYMGGGFYLASGATTVSNSAFTGNTAAAYGGAISGIGLTITGTRLDDNSAPGGSAIRAGDSVVITHSVFDGNHATKDGGTVYSLGTGFRLSNSIFSESDSEKAPSALAGAVLINGGDAKLWNNTIVDSHFSMVSGSNTSAGDVYLKGASSVDLRDNILYGRGPTLTRYGIYAADTTPVTSLASNDVYNYKSKMNSAINGTGTPASADPQLVAVSDDGNYCNEDYHLSSTSPYLDMDAYPDFEDPDGSYGQYGAYGGPEGAWSVIPTSCGGSFAADVPQSLTETAPDGLEDAAPEADQADDAFATALVWRPALSTGAGELRHAPLGWTHGTDSHTLPRTDALLAGNAAPAESDSNLERLWHWVAHLLDA